MTSGRSGVLRMNTVARRGWRSTAGLGVLLALATATSSAFLVGSWGAATTAFEDGLGDAVAQAPPYQRDINLELYPDTFLDAAPQRPPGSGRPAPFDPVSEAVHSVMTPRMQELVGEEFVSAQSDPMVVKGTGVSGRTVQAVVRLDDGFGSRVRWVAGKAPGRASTQLTIDTLSRTPDQALLRHRVRVIPVAMRERTARSWGIQVGDVLRFERTNRPEDALTDSAAVVVAGLFAPQDPRDPFWSAETRMLGIAKVPTPQGGTIEEASVLAPTSSYGDLTDSLGRTPASAPTGVFPALHHQWRFTLRHDRLVRSDVREIRSLLSRLQVDPGLWSAETGQPQVLSGLKQVFSRYDRSVRTTTVIVSFAALGAAVLALLVLALLSLVLVRRRTSEIGLIRARGAGVGQVTHVVLAGVLAWSLPALVLGLLAGLVFGGGSVDAVTVVATAVVELAIVLPALVQTHAGSRIRSHPARSGRSVARTRRLVAEVTLVALAVGGVVSVRARGEDIARGQVDWFAAVAPTLIALAAAVILLRLLPPAFRWGAARVAQGRGHVVFLGLSRAAASARTSAIPLIAIVVSAGLVSLMASVTMTIRSQRDLIAHQMTGAAARVDYTRLDAAVVDRLAARPGVEAVLPAVVLSARLSSGDRTQRLTLIGVDPQRYADLLDGTPIDFTVPAPRQGDLQPPPGADTVTMLVSEAASDLSQPTLTVAGGSVPATVAAVDPRLNRMLDGHAEPVAIVALDRLTAAVPGIQPDTAFLRMDQRAGRALSRDASAESRPLGRLATDVTVAQDLTDQLSQRPLSVLTTVSYLTGLVVAGLLGMLALALLVGASRPERVATALRLRALGMPGAHAGRMWLVEIVPVVVLAGTVGAVTGMVAPAVLTPALDLRPFVGGPERLPLTTLSVTALAISVLVITFLSILTLVLDARWSRRVSVAEGLRQGEQP